MPVKVRHFIVAAFVLVLVSLTVASPVIVWVPSYSISTCKNMLQRDFGGVGMKDGVTYLALQFYGPRGGTIFKAGGSDADIAWFRDWAHQYDIKVLLCIYNAAEGDWDWGKALNSFRDNRTAFVNSIMAEVDRLGFDGVDIDLEGPGDYNGDADAFITFCTELAGRLHAKGKVMTIASFGNQWNAPNWDWWPRLFSESGADGICSMGYDYSGRSKDYAAQVEHASAAPERFMIGMPGWMASWQGNTVLEQLDWVIDNGVVGMGIWDCALSASGWQTAAVWNKIKTIRDQGPDLSGPFTLTLDAAHGSIEASPQQAQYEKGSSVTLKAVADEGYVFAQWSGDASGSDSHVTVTMDRNRSVSALFAPTGDLIVNGDFSGGATGWQLAVTNGAAASGAESGGVYGVSTQTTGSETWHVQLLQAGLALVKGKRYVLRFTASASTPGTISVNVGQASSPWASYLTTRFAPELTATPRLYEYAFTMEAASDANARLEFNSGLADIDWRLDDVSLQISDASPVVAGRSLAVPLQKLSVTGRTARFSLPSAGSVTIDLRDVQGKLIRRLTTAEFGAGAHAVGLPALSAGIYLITLDGPGGRTSLHSCQMR